MRSRLATLVAVVGLIASLTPVASATGHSRVMLSLGDSVAAGTQNPDAFTDDGYADVLFGRLADDLDLDELVNLACPGDDSFEMYADLAAEAVDGVGSHCYGAVAPFGPGGTGHRPAGDSQLDAALAYLATTDDEVALITLTIGANDVTGCLDDPDVVTCVTNALTDLGNTNLPTIVASLQAAAPGVPIVATNYYNPNVALYVVGDVATVELTQGLIGQFNDVLEGVYGFFGVTVADVESAFDTFDTTGSTPRNVKSVCKYTRMCEKAGDGYVLSDWDPGSPGPQPDIHPSDKGHERITTAFLQAMEASGIL